MTGKGGLILVALAIAVALSATWFHKKYHQYETFTAQLDKNKVDYYLSEFSLTVTNPDGGMKYKVSGDHFVHHVETKTSEIYKPSIVVAGEETSLSLKATKAIHNTNGDIQLQGSTIINKPVDKENAGFTLQTSDILYSPTTKMVNTDSDVILETTDGVIIKGKGLSEDIESMITRLKSNVHAEYTPQAQ